MLVHLLIIPTDARGYFYTHRNTQRTAGRHAQVWRGPWAFPGAGVYAPGAAGEWAKPPPHCGGAAEALVPKGEPEGGGKGTGRSPAVWRGSIGFGRPLPRGTLTQDCEPPDRRDRLGGTHNVL